MATLASLTAPLGNPGDDFTDSSGIKRVITKVDADGVYTWAKVPEAIAASDPNIMEVGDMLIMKGSFTVATNPQLVTLPASFANDAYSVILQITSGPFGFATIGLMYNIPFTAKNAGDFTVTFEPNPSFIGSVFDFLAFGEKP